MSKFELRLCDSYSKKLGTGPTAKKIFNQIKDKEKVILNFENIEFMSRSFAQEYIVQKYYSQTEVTEINMNNTIKQLLEVVCEDFKETCLKY